MVREFKSKDQAVAWLKRAIKRDMTTFGCGTVLEVERVEYASRCRWCICGGVRDIRRYVLSDDGIEYEEARNDCAYED